MKVVCDKGEILEKMGTISGIVPTNSPKPILHDFLLQARDGALFVEANDLEVAARVRIDRVETRQDGRLALPAAKLISILREIPESAAGVTLESDGSQQGNKEGNQQGNQHGAALHADGYEFKLFGHDPDEFPGVSEIEASRSLEIACEVFAQSLRRVSVAVSRDPTRYQLGGVFFEVKSGKVTLTATDGKRLTNDQFKVEDGAGKETEAIVPGRAVDAILKMLGALDGEGEKFTLGFTDTDVVVRTANSQLNARLIEGTYPNYRNALPHSASVKVRLRRGELLTAARSAQLMVDDQTSAVIFRFEGESLRIWSQARNVGETRIQIRAEVENGPLEIRFNPSYFVDALRCIDDEEVRIEFQTSDRPGVLRGGAHYRHMIMPLVLEAR